MSIDGYHGILWVFMGLWVSMSTSRCFWIFGCPWVFMGVMGDYGCLGGFMGFWVSMGTYGWHEYLCILYLNIKNIAYFFIQESQKI